MITVQRLHVTSALDDALLTRLRIERLLAAVQVRLFSPSALVVIRHLPDPLPGTIDLRRDWLRPPLAWEQAFIAQLERYFSAAVRPAVMPVPANTPAVWFADEAERLACLSADWVHDELTDHWWWAAGLRGDPRAVVEAAWIDHPDAIPAALHHLAARRLHDAVLARLGDTALDTITQQVERVYGLPAVRTRAFTPEQLHVAPRWLTTFVPEVGVSRLPPAPRRLLAIGLLLARRPADARHLLRTWLDAMAAARGAAGNRLYAPPALPLGTVEAAPVAPVTGDAQLLPGGAAQHMDVDAPTVQPGAVPATPATAADMAILLPTLSALHTQCGGTFFLLNVALALHLYGDFSEPQFEGLALSPWEWLTLVSARMLGAAWHVDALPTLLADLAGREVDGLPEATPPAEWRMPPTWLSAFPEGGECRALVAGERLQVLHPAGFVLADVPLRAEGDAQAQAIAQVYDLTCRPVEPAEGESPFAADVCTWDAWVTTFVPYLRARLLRALDLPPETYLTIPAHVFASATHVDVMFALADLPLEVRMAGLDRDIGWLPAAGRTIRFHFE